MKIYAKNNKIQTLIYQKFKHLFTLRNIYVRSL